MTAVSVFPAVIFDYNGVLVDDEDVHLRAFQEVLAPRGIALTERDYWDKYLGYDDAGAFGAILQASGRQPSQGDVRELVEAKRPIYRQLAAAELRTFPGAQHLLQWLATRATLGIVSGALREEIELGLAVLGAQELFSFVVSAEDTARSKPDPEGYLLGKEKVSALASAAVASQILVVEDSLSGVEAAKAAHMSCLALCHSYSATELRASGADAVVDRLLDVTPELLAALYRSHRG